MPIHLDLGAFFSSSPFDAPPTSPVWASGNENQTENSYDRYFHSAWEYQQGIEWFFEGDDFVPAGWYGPLQPYGYEHFFNAHCCANRMIYVPTPALGLKEGEFTLKSYGGGLMWYGGCFWTLQGAFLPDFVTSGSPVGSAWIEHQCQTWDWEPNPECSEEGRAGVKGRPGLRYRIAWSPIRCYLASAHFAKSRRAPFVPMIFLPFPLLFAFQHMLFSSTFTPARKRNQ